MQSPIEHLRISLSIRCSNEFVYAIGKKKYNIIVIVVLYKLGHYAFLLISVCPNHALFIRMAELQLYLFLNFLFSLPIDI